MGRETSRGIKFVKSCIFRRRFENLTRLKFEAIDLVQILFIVLTLFKRWKLLGPFRIETKKFFKSIFD